MHTGTSALVVDEWSVLRTGVAAVLGGVGLRCVHASSLVEAQAHLRRDEYPLIILGAVPDGSETLAVRELRAQFPSCAIVALLAAADRGVALDVLDAGATAVLARNAEEHELRDAVGRAARGERYVAGMLLSNSADQRSLRQGPADLTDRERGVLTLVASGRSNREIADELFIGEATVKTHLRNIYEKLDVTNRVQAVGRAMELKLL